MQGADFLRKVLILYMIRLPFRPCIPLSTDGSKAERNIDDMKFCDKLIILRREKGYSQEQLAEYLGVSRQSVSKWEASSSMPELTKLIQLSELFGVTTDYLVKDHVTEKQYVKQDVQSGGSEIDETQKRLLDKLEKMEEDQKNRVKEFEYKSERTLFGLPLVHIHVRWLRSGVIVCGSASGMRANVFGWEGDFTAKARGILAIGNSATGLLAIGILAKGLMSIGVFSLGFLSLGILTLGLLAGGIVSLGVIAAGVVAIGIVSMGVSAIGFYSTGCAVLAKEVGTGISVCAKTAVGAQGEDVKGLFIMLTDQLTKRENVMDFIRMNHPQLSQWILKILVMWYK